MSNIYLYDDDESTLLYTFNDNWKFEGLNYERQSNLIKSNFSNGSLELGDKKHMASEITLKGIISNDYLNPVISLPSILNRFGRAGTWTSGTQLTALADAGGGKYHAKNICEGGQILGHKVLYKGAIYIISKGTDSANTYGAIIMAANDETKIGANANEVGLAFKGNDTTKVYPFKNIGGTITYSTGIDFNWTTAVTYVVKIEYYEAGYLRFKIWAQTDTEPGAWMGTYNVGTANIYGNYFGASVYSTVGATDMLILFSGTTNNDYYSDDFYLHMSELNRALSQTDILITWDNILIKKYAYTIKYLKAVQSRVTEVKYFEGAFGRAAEVDIAFVLESPYLITRESKTIAVAYTGTPQTMNIFNPKNIDIYPKISVAFSAGAAADFILQNNTDNSNNFSFIYTFGAATPTFVFDCDLGTVKESTTSRMAQFAGVFLRLVPGNNVIVFTGNAGNGTVSTISFELKEKELI